MKSSSTPLSTHDDHDHHLGLAHDLTIMAQRNMQRRQALSWLLAGGSAALLVGCGGGGDDTASSSSSSGGASSSSSSSSSSSGGSTGSCIANATETGGPFPSDGSNTVNGMVSNVLQQSGVVRSDIRSSFGSSTNTAGGVQLDLAIQVVNSNNSCVNLSGYAVYIWHCTREGGYSLYSSGVTAENFLRGVQVTGDNGIVNFTTIFPGCYSGRYPHMHIEVYPSLSMATLYTNRVLTSQFAMPRDVCNTVYAGATGYSASVSNLAAVTVASDGVFGDNSTAQIAQMTPSLSGTVAAGYTGTILVGVPV
jgi:protocatechuate 3,4-dioxygenase beta subunit